MPSKANLRARTKKLVSTLRMSSSAAARNGTTTAAAAAKAKQTLRILCFGDSLTAGYSLPGTPASKYNPYRHSLARRLASAFPSLRIDCLDVGLPGDVVSGGGFAQRIEPRFLTQGGTPFDWTIVLGGTNDLGYGYEPDVVFEKLRGVWAVPLSRGSKVLALTVPEAGFAEGAKYNARRDALNGLIKGHKQENFHVFDLHAAVPLFSLQDSERDKYWMRDRVHLTSKGYDLMGERIAAALVDIMMPPGRLQANGNKPTKRRKVFKDDDKKFVEESGDEKLLDQGYVVVRWDDLS